MKLLRNKWLVALLVVLATCAALSLLNCGNGPRSGISFSFKSIINPHESPTPWLKVAGKKYEKVRGVEPFHLRIPGANAVFFITSDRSSGDIAHFVFVESGEAHEIPLGHVYLGHGIGMPKAAYSYDSVDGFEWPILTVSSRLYNRITRYEFNLIDKKYKESESRVEESQPKEGGKP